MKVGLCDFKTPQEMKPFLYKEKASLSDKISVFFHRIVYFIPAGFTWLDSNRVVTLLHDNQLDKEVEPLFQQIDVNKNVRERIQAIAFGVISSDIQKKIKEKNYASRIEAYPTCKHPNFEIVRRAAKESLTPQDVDALKDVNLDDLDSFFNDLRAFEHVIGRLNLMGIIVDEKSKNDFIGNKHKNRLDGGENVGLTVFENDLIIKVFKDFRIVGFYYDALTTESFSTKTTDFIKRTNLYNIDYNRIIALCRSSLNPENMIPVLNELRSKALPLLIKDLKDVPENIITHDLLKRVRAGDPLSEKDVSELFDLVGSAKVVGLLTALRSLVVERRRNLIKQLATLPNSVYEKYSKHFPIIKLILIAIKEGELNKQEIDEINRFDPTHSKNGIESINRRLTFLNRMSKLGFSSDHEHFFLDDRNTDFELERQYYFRLSDLKLPLQRINYLSEFAKKLKWDTSGFSPDELLFLNVLPNHEIVFEEKIVDPINKWTDQAKEPSRIREVAASLKQKLEIAALQTIDQFRQEALSLSTEEVNNYTHYGNGYRVKEIILLCHSPKKGNEEENLKYLNFINRYPNWKVVISQYKEAMKEMGKAKKLGVEFEGPFQDDLIFTSKNEISVKAEQKIFSLVKDQRTKLSPADKLLSSDFTQNEREYLEAVTDDQIKALIQKRAAEDTPETFSQTYTKLLAKAGTSR